MAIALNGSLEPSASFPVLHPVEPQALHPGSGPVRVYTMGSMRVERGVLTVTSLGGPKAGANQALALFAFLFDRGDRGVEKDEAIEVIWPDAALPIADSAFHRTLLGLRRSLSSDRSIDTIRFRSGRFVLAPGVVAWSDLAELEGALNSSATATDVPSRVRLLERCRDLGRGDFMDDCPFYGASSYVEPRRSMLRSVREAILLELADLYDASGLRALAALRRGEAGLGSES